MTDIRVTRRATKFLEVNLVMITQLDIGLCDVRRISIFLAQWEEDRVRTEYLPPPPMEDEGKLEETKTTLSMTSVEVSIERAASNP